MVYLTFVVVFGTLVVQGGLLPFGLRLLGFRASRAPRRAELEARAEAARAAIERIDQAEQREEHEQALLDALRGSYDRRLERLDRLLEQDDEGRGETIRRRRDRRAIRAEVLAAERDRVERLRNEGRIGTDEMGRIIRELDLEDVSMREGGRQDV